MQRWIQAIFLVAALSIGLTPYAITQQTFLPGKLDLTSDIASPLLESTIHQPLPEQYIWAPAVKAADRDKPLYFHDTFVLRTVPRVATLYIAGPDRLRVYVNGRLVANAQLDPASRLKPLVLSIPVTPELRTGRNTLAIEASHGNRLAVKIVPRAPGLTAPALIMSDGGWQYSEHMESGWEQRGYKSSPWRAIHALGGIENGNLDWLRWNADAGMYQWPGYDGISPFLAHMAIPVDHVVTAFPGLGRLINTTAIAPFHAGEAAQGQEKTIGEDFKVTLPPPSSPQEEYPYLLLDMGREVAGRLELVSDSDASMRVELQYGESEEEAINEPYLGVDSLTIPPHATVHGPKSAFRFVLVRFMNGVSPARLRAVRVDSIYYPVYYQGSFESSDSLLNRIWLVGAYTSHLSMLDEIWDAPKRDRAPYGGDLNVSGRVIETVFGDHFLVPHTMDDLISPPGQPVTGDVNGISGYSAFWVMDQADYYRHIGDRGYLLSIHQRLVGLLDYMQTELDDRQMFVPPHNSWPFIDWSPGLSGDTPEVRRGTTLEFAKGFAEGAWLLSEIGDAGNAAKYSAEAKRIRESARKYLLDPATGTFGSRWQINAMAIVAGVAEHDQKAAIWDKVLSHPDQFGITPYYNYYVIEAMAASGHRKEALNWLRAYWGGMIEEGATTFWEAYDLDWPKVEFHKNLQADNTGGYYVSLCHGWSSGATAWLSEQILGIQPQGAGFRKVSIRPDLVGLEWARGAEPTPQGPIKVDLHAVDSGLRMVLNLPPGVDAEVSMPAPPGVTSVQVNGRLVSSHLAEDGTRLVVDLNQSGTYNLSTPSLSP